MSQNDLGSNAKSQGSAPDQNAGDKPYRAYVGPPQEYDLVSAMVFNLLTSAGLREHHRLLDVGCGSLRAGRLLIPYLNEGCYFGVDPNKPLVEAGIANEVGMDLIRIKKPTFSFKDSMKDFNDPLNLDYAVAQSIFSHCGIDLIESWLEQISFHLKPTGALFATFVPGLENHAGSGWVYPSCVYYTPIKLAEIASKFGLYFMLLDWAHTRQAWGLFAKKDYDQSYIGACSVSWNRFVATTLRKNAQSKNM